ETNKLFLERACQEHPAKRFQKTLVGRRDFARSCSAQRCGRGFFSFWFCGPLRRLKHRVILAKIGKRAQSFLWRLNSAATDGTGPPPRRKNQTADGAGAPAPQVNDPGRPVVIVFRKAEGPIALRMRGVAASAYARYRLKRAQ